MRALMAKTRILNICVYRCEQLCVACAFQLLLTPPAPLLSYLLQLQACTCNPLLLTPGPFINAHRFLPISFAAVI